MTRKILAKVLEQATEVRGKRSEDRFGRKSLGLCRRQNRDSQERDQAILEEERQKNRLKKKSVV